MSLDKWFAARRAAEQKQALLELGAWMRVHRVANDKRGQLVGDGLYMGDYKPPWLDNRGMYFYMPNSKKLFRGHPDGWDPAPNSKELNLKDFPLPNSVNLYVEEGSRIRDILIRIPKGATVTASAGQIKICEDRSSRIALDFCFEGRKGFILLNHIQFPELV